VASIFNAFGCRVQILEAAPRILLHADDDVAAAVAAAFRASGMPVQENFGAIESFEKTATGVRMNFSKDGHRGSAEAALAVVAVGWAADTAGLSLATAGVELNQRGFVKVDEYLRTSVDHVFAAGDVTGRLMLVPEAIQDGFVAATNAVRGPTMPIRDRVSPSGSFTDPEFGQVGLTETKARQTHNIVTAVVRFDSTTRTIIDGHKSGFCKLIADADTARILGCHVVGERARVRDRQHDVHLRVDLLELAQHDGQDAPSGACRGSDLEPALQLALGLLAELREQLLLEREQPLRAAIEPVAGLGRLHPTSGAIEEPLAETFLERPDLQADRGLRHPELVGGLREAPALDDRAEGCKLLRVHKADL